jgi:hypothetical protein
MRCVSVECLLLKTTYDKLGLRRFAKTMPFKYRHPFRGRRSLRFWLIVVVSFHVILAVVVMRKRNSAVNTEDESLLEREKNYNTRQYTDVTFISSVNDTYERDKNDEIIRAKKTTKKPKIDMVNDYQPWIDFKFVYPEIQPTIDESKDFFMVVLVNSGANGNEHRKRRAKIRETWANRSTCEHENAKNNSRVKDKEWILVFVLGKTGIKEEDERNIEEAKQHNDLIIGDIKDNYLNNILKFYMGQLWASLLGTKYTLKTDDDVYVRIPKVIEYLVSEGSPSRFYGGWTYPHTKVDRLAGGKWSISERYFPEDVYPPFHAGAFIVISSDLLGSLINYVHFRKPFHTDDAYIGVAMKDLKVEVVRIRSFHLNHKMAVFIRGANACYILKVIAYGHSVNTNAMQYLHGRVEDLCRKVVTMKNC